MMTSPSQPFLSGLRRITAAALVAGSLAALAAPRAAVAQATEKPPSPDTAPVRLDPVNVTGQSEEGYRIATVAPVGPWGERSFLDTPYSINVVTEDLIQNLQANSAYDLFRVNPFAQQFSPQTRAGFSTAISLRGFNLSDADEDGLRNSSGYNISLEDKERVETLTGLSGFLYGAGNVGGIVNYISKRPTATPTESLTFGNAGGDSYYAHADAGGPLGKALGYRVNLVRQGGGTAVDEQSLNRWLVSSAFDWHLATGVLLQLNASRQHYRIDGLPAYWAIAPGVRRPAAPAAARLWTQKWPFQSNDQDRYGARLAWDLGQHFTVRAAFGYTYNEREWHSVNHTITSATTYTSLYIMQAPAKNYDEGRAVYLDSRFSTGPVEHRITIGGSEDDSRKRRYQDAEARANIAGTFKLSAPTYIAEPAYATIGTKPFYTSAILYNRNLSVGDDLSWGEHWSALLGANLASINAINYSTASAVTSSYDKRKATPTASLLFKPLKWLSTYATFMQSLEQGVVVPSTSSPAYTNAGEILAPLTSSQYELGARADVGALQFTAAVFRIEKANQLDVTNANKTHTYIQDGREIHQGVELGTAGKVIPGLAVFGGFTVMDTEVTHQQASPALEGKRPLGIAERIAKLHFEYELPWIPRLVLLGGVNFTGPFYSDAANTDLLPSATTFDTGLRYTFHLGRLETALRLNVDNLADKSCWVSPYYVGDPRTFRFSAQVRF